MNIQTAAWHWPQWVVIGLYMGGLLTSSVLHGEERRKPNGEVFKYSLPLTAYKTITMGLLLVAGGFFG